ncbi:MAG TPA: hypothetical protein EYG83_07855 [Sulfurospirillum arcachonense]|nr:hypothetical protein [Sulfurospirillum arcachonense]
MDKIKVLEEIGLKRVCDETHIEQKYLKFMVDNDYDKLNHINTLGFVKILSREYKIDLSAWTEAFEEYWIQNHKDKEDNGLFIVVNDEKKSKKLLVFIVIVLLGATLSILFSLFQEKIDISNYVNNSESSYENTTVIQEAQQSLDEVNSSLEQSEPQVTMFDDTNSSEEAVSVEETITEEIADEVIVEEVTTEELIEEKKTEVKEITEPTKKVSPRFSQEAVITPNSELWIGIIYLDTKKRRSFLGEGNFSIDISREQIITTGHGSFNLSVNGKIREFNRQAPMRFLVKDLNLTEIDWSKFKELNEGKSW